MMPLLRRIRHQPRVLVPFLAADIWRAGKISVLGEDNKWCLCSVRDCVAVICRQRTRVLNPSVRLVCFAVGICKRNQIPFTSQVIANHPYLPFGSNGINLPGERWCLVLSLEA